MVGRSSRYFSSDIPKWTAEAIRMTSSILTGSNEGLLHTQREHTLTHVAAPKTSGISISPILQRSRQDDSAIAKIPLAPPPLSAAPIGIVGSTCRNFAHVPNTGVCFSCLLHTYVIVEILFLREKYTRWCNEGKKVSFWKLLRRNKIKLPWNSLLSQSNENYSNFA